LGEAPVAALCQNEMVRYESQWEGFRLIVDARPEHWQVFVYDPAVCEVVSADERVNLNAAKCAAVDFAAVTRFGPHHDLKPEVIVAMLEWEGS
jgi:hypothetical protein